MHSLFHCTDANITVPLNNTPLLEMVIEADPARSPPSLKLFLSPQTMLSEQKGGSSNPQINGISDCNGKHIDGRDEFAWIETVAVPIFAVDLPLHIVSWNRRMAALTGISAQELLKTPLKSILADNSHKKLERAVHDVQFAESSPSCYLTFCINGSLRSFHVRLSAQLNATNHVVGSICFAEEIRPPIHPGPSKPLSEFNPHDEIHNVFENMEVPAFSIDFQGRIVFWNTLIEKVTGYASDDVVEKPLADYIVDESGRRKVQDAVGDVKKSGKAAPFVVEIQSKIGHVKSIMLRVSTCSNSCMVVLIVVAANEAGAEQENGKHRNEVFSEDKRLAWLFERTALPPMFGLNLDGTINNWNSKLVELTGFEKDETVGFCFAEKFISPTYRSSFQTFTNDCRSGKECSTEMELVLKGEKSIQVSMTGAVITDGAGKKSRLLVFINDLTSAVIGDATSRELEKLLESANLLIFGIDKLGDINLWNSATQDALGFSKDFVLGKPLVESFIDPLLKPSVQSMLDMAQEGKGTTNYEMEIETSSGEIRYLLVNITSRRNVNEEIVGVVLFAQDVTEAAQHDRAVAAMARELRQLLDTANTPIFGVDTAGRVNEWNDKTAEITGFSGDEAFNQPLVESFIVPDLKASVQEVLDNALRGRGTSNFELEIRTKADETRFLLVNATTRRDAENNVVGVVAVAQDVTEACKHDRAVAAMANELRQLIDTANAPIFGIDRDG